tara:strand:- start:1469 stop:1681 length:213 start_codon:yes stop_codon:yes gene_type:complete
MKNQKKKPLKQFLKFSNLGIQMGIIIGLGSYLGFRLDNYFKLDNIFTICSSLVGIFGALFYVIRDVKNFH